MRRQASVRPKAGEILLGPVHVEVCRSVAEQAQHDRPVRRVALSGEGQRAVEGDAHAQPRLRGRSGPARLGEQLEKGGGGGHRPHGVGRGRTDAHLEDVEDAQEHEDPNGPNEGPRQAASAEWGPEDLSPWASAARLNRVSRRSNSAHPRSAELHG